MTLRYSSREEMVKLFRIQGVERRLQEDEDCDEVLNFHIDDATSTIDSLAAQVYNETDLRNSSWVRIRATWLACFRLSQRGGDPSLFYGRFAEIMEELQKVKDGLLAIPGLSTRYDLVPSMSNIEHDPRYFDATRRVDAETSTPNMGGTRPRDISQTPLVSLW